MSNVEWMVYESEDDAYLFNNAGYMATPDEMKAVIAKLASFMENKCDAITANNIKVDRFFEDLRRGVYHKEADQPSAPSGKKRYLYMFKSGKNKYKIGVSVDVGRRLKQLNNRPYPVELFAVSKVPFYRAFEVEREMHDLHASDNIDGEWFEIDDERAELTACIIESADDDYENGRGD